MRLDTGFLCDGLHGITNLFKLVIVRDSLSADDDPQSCCAGSCGLYCRLDDFLCSDEGIDWGVRVVESGLCAKCTVFRATAGLCVDNRATGDRFAAEMNAEPVCGVDQEQKMWQGKR